MKIGIDAGHGLYTPGKRCAKQFDNNETREWVLNNRVATKVCNVLNSYDNIEAIRLDDTTGNTDIALNTRVRNANNMNFDLVVSIHHNARWRNRYRSICIQSSMPKWRNRKIGKISIR